MSESVFVTNCPDPAIGINVDDDKRCTRSYETTTGDRITIEYVPVTENQEPSLELPSLLDELTTNERVESINPEGELSLPTLNEQIDPLHNDGHDPEAPLRLP